MLLVSCGAEDTPPAGDQPTPEQTAGDQSTQQPAGDQPTQPPAGDQSTSQPPATGAGVVSTGFVPAVNGFSYQNYGDTGVTPGGDTFPVVNLTSVEMRRLFGDAVCAAPAAGDNTCVLTPPAQQWMDQNNASMQGGHCEGFAVLSQMIFGGQVDPNQFGAATAADLKIQGNEPLQRELAYWWTTQGPTWQLQQILAPKDAVNYLTDQYTKDPKDLFRLGIMKEDKTGGHAITAYAVADQGNGITWIMVYDNNYPGQERHITVDMNANTWEYEASINPSVAPDLYKGSVTNPILIAADQPRLQKFPCDFCSPSASASKGGNHVAAGTPKFNEIWTEGYVNIELQDEKGRKIGYDEKGNFVDEITEANLQPVLAGPLSEVPPVIDMPVGLGFTTYIYGDSKAADEPASVTMIGQGFYIGIDGLLMAPEQLDQLTFDGEGDAMTYTTDAQESPFIVVGIEKEKADFELQLKATKVSKGTDINVLFDQKEETFAFETTSDAPAEFELSITRIDADGKEETFSNGDTPIKIDPGKLMYFYFGKWGGQGSNLEVGFDANGDGTIEASEIYNMADAK
ncbi:MAG: hypothetical protein WA821_08045 [Anaerolineales bacterium]